jgi:hypothetical protein
MKKTLARVLIASLPALLLVNACTSTRVTPFPSLTLPPETAQPSRIDTEQPTPLPVDATPLPSADAELVPSSTPTQSEPTVSPQETEDPFVEATLETPTGASPATQTETSIAIPRIPLDTLYIVRPGQMSRVISPLRLEAYVITGEKELVKIELLGEDGRVLNRQILRYSGMNPGVRFQILPEIDFEIPTVSEAGRLVISISDKEDRTIVTTTVDLVLLSIGEAEINPQGDLLAPFYLQAPRENQLIQGGSLVVSGWARPMSDQPVIIELINDEGQAIISKQIEIDPDPEGKHVPFEAEIPYTILKGTYARITVHQSGGRIPGDVALDSVKVYLSP